ncbi:unnamed protein product [Caenorhabditis brenneri]
MHKLFIFILVLSLYFLPFIRLEIPQRARRSSIRNHEETTMGAVLLIMCWNFQSCTLPKTDDHPLPDCRRNHHGFSHQLLSLIRHSILRFSIDFSHFHPL